MQNYSDRVSSGPQRRLARIIAAGGDPDDIAIRCLEALRLTPEDAEILAAGEGQVISGANVIADRWSSGGDIWPKNGGGTDGGR